MAVVARKQRLKRATMEPMTMLVIISEASIVSFWELSTAKRRLGWQSVDAKFVVEELPCEHSHKYLTATCSRFTCDNRRKVCLCIHTLELRGAMYAARLGQCMSDRGVWPPKVKIRPFRWCRYRYVLDALKCTCCDAFVH